MAKAVTVEKKDKFQDAIDKLEKSYGKGVVITGDKIETDLQIVPSGSIGIDLALGIGGLPVGKLIEIYGPESSGKSTICLHLEAAFQKLPGKCVLVDFEHSYDKKYARTLGVDVDNLIITQPDCMEDGYNIIETLIRTGDVRLVVIDSHTAAMPKAVVEGEVGDAKIALQARFNSIGLGKIKPLLKPNNCTLTGVSQLRTAIGSYGDPDKPTGGNAWKFYSDIRIKVSKQLDKEKESNKTTVEIVKNKCAAPFGKAVFAINWGTGIDKMAEIIEAAAEFKLIEKGGAGWYTVNGVKLQGDTNVKQFLQDNQEYYLDLEKQVINMLKESN